MNGNCSTCYGFGLWEGEHYPILVHELSYAPCDDCPECGANLDSDSTSILLGPYKKSTQNTSPASNSFSRYCLELEDYEEFIKKFENRMVKCAEL